MLIHPITPRNYMKHYRGGEYNYHIERGIFSCPIRNKASVNPNNAD